MFRYLYPPNFSILYKFEATEMLRFARMSLRFLFGKHFHDDLSI